MSVKAAAEALAGCADIRTASNVMSAMQPREAAPILRELALMQPEVGFSTRPLFSST